MKNKIFRIKSFTLSLTILLTLIGIVGNEMEVNSMVKNSKSAELQQPKLSLIPWPQEITFKDGGFTPKTQLIFLYPAGNEKVEQVAQQCVSDFNDLGFSTFVDEFFSKNNGRLGQMAQNNTCRVILGIQKNGEEDFNKESYSLQVGESHISISASTTTGLFWGTRTLLQLLDKGPNQIIPQLSITDEPNFEYRGLMIDNARSFHSINFHLEMIRKMASYKLNFYMIHFNDSEGYTLPSEKFPNLPQKGRHYTKEEIRQLVDTAKKYHVNIVPSIDVPGHADALNLAIPELRLTKFKLNIAKEETYQILQTLFGEVMEMIPGTYWHLGGDEVGYYDPQLGADSLEYPDINNSPSEAYSAFMRKENLTHGKQLMNYFINRMYDFVKSKGRKMIIWDFFPTIEPFVNREIIVAPDYITRKGKNPQDYINAGYKLLNNGWDPLYVTFRTYVSTPERIAMWNPYMFIKDEVPSTSPIIGAQMCSWSNEEKGEWGLLLGLGPRIPGYARPGPRLQIMAERAWIGKKTSKKDILERAGADYSGKTGTFIDIRDNKTYRWVAIGEQIWMAENLNYDAGSGSWVYDDKPLNAVIYGRLYNWKTAHDVCPDGWHLPTDAEWTELTDYLGGESVAGSKLKETGIIHWNNPNKGATNSSSFSALPGGGKDQPGSYFTMGDLTYFWSSTEAGGWEVWIRRLDFDGENINRYYYRGKEYGFSVRCVMNSAR